MIMGSVFSSEIFSGANKFLVGLLIFFIILVVGQVWYYENIRKPQLEQASRAIIPTSIPRKNPFENHSRTNPLNQIAYYDVKNKITARQHNIVRIQESRFEGIILSIYKDKNDLVIQLESLLSNSEGKKVWYVYNESVLPKISVLQNKKELSIDQLAPRDQVTIDEGNDFTKEYPQSIVWVKINKVSPQ